MVAIVGWGCVVTDQPDPPVLVNPFRPVALAVRDCLCNAFDAFNRPVCQCNLFHGEQPPPMDLCDCECSPGVSGQAWVRVALLDPSGHVSAGRCGGGLMGARLVVELGVYRCVAVPDDQGRPPDGGEQAADTLDAFDDASVLLHAALCCGELEDRGAVLGQWEPMGPAGGCAGSRLPVFVNL